jgi:1-acyl-sn-glycerol-3-phosphate acyltransferase
VAESIAYRSIVVATQCASWVVGQLLRLRYSVRAEFQSNDFKSNSDHCLIFAPMHKTVLDPCLLMIALNYRRWRALVPIRTLATQTFVGPLRWLNWFKPLIRIVYRLEGAVEPPPEGHDQGFHPEKVRGLLVALNQGDVIVIFPEGEIWRKREPPIGEFAPGVVYLQRKSGAPIILIAVWMSDRAWPRRRYVVRFGEPIQIPDHLDFDAGAAWLRECALKLYERAKQDQK